jgi:predicted RND superfamily exporter protein
MISWISRLLVRRAGLITAVSLMVTVVAAYYSVQLFKNLRTDFEELLPTTARSVIDLKEVSHRLESIDNLAVLIFSKDTAASKKLVDDLAKKLERQPKSVIASVEYKIDRELQFFARRQALYMDLKDLLSVRNYIDQRIEYEKELYNPLNIFNDNNLDEPKLDFEAIRKKYEGKAAAYSRFPSGYYATPDGTKRVVLVYKPGGTGMDVTHALRHAVDEALAELKPRSYASDIEIKFAGGVQDQIEEHEALIEDLEWSTVLVTVVVAFAMWLFFRNLRATFALVASLFMGTFWTFGLSFFLVGYLNANSAFMGSIVIGNGINFGVIYLARYLEARRLGRDNEQAIRESLAGTVTSTGTAALAAGLAYGSLMLTSFRGFNQFGVIGFVGMILCWLSAVTMLPAILTVLDRWKPLVPASGEKAPKQYFTLLVAYLIQKHPKAIWAASVALSVVSLAMFTRYTPAILETDMSKLRDIRSMESGSGFNSRYQDEIFQRYLSPNVILPQSREDALKIAASLKKLKAEQGDQSLIASVQTIDDFVPSDQEAKIEVIRQIRALLSPRLLRRIAAEDQKLISEFLTPETRKPITIADLPPLVLSKFTEKNGAVGKLVVVEPPLTEATREGYYIMRIIRELREAADAAKPGTAVAGGLCITADMIEAIAKDGPKATLFAFLAVVLLVVVLFRNVKTIALTLFALLMGVLWLAGIILGFGLKINFLNFIALPITFGIGVDYGVNIFQRYREEKDGDIVNVVRHTGGAVMLASFTTIAGYLSLLIAGNQGFVSFGLLAVAGEVTCVAAAVIALPAFLAARRKKGTPILSETRSVGPSGSESSRRPAPSPEQQIHQ